MCRFHSPDGMCLLREAQQTAVVVAGFVEPRKSLEY